MAVNNGNQFIREKECFIDKYTQKQQNKKYEATENFVEFSETYLK